MKSMPQRNKPDYAAPALEKGIDILELLASEPEALTQNQIAVRLKRSTSEIFRMLDVLVRRGYVVRDAAGSYSQTLKLFELAHRQVPGRRLIACALPVMERVSRLIRQSIHLSVHYDRRILVVAQLDSPEPMSFSVRLGSHYPFRADRASALVLTAFQSPEEQEVLVAEMVANSAGRPDIRALRTEIARVRRLGYYQKPSNVIRGVIQFSFPLFSGGSGAIAALASPYLRQRDVKTGLVGARNALAAAAREISASLGADTARARG